MPSFKYRARDSSGALVTGAIEAEDRAGTEAALDRMGLIPIKIEPQGGLSLPSLKGFLNTERVSRQDLILFSRQLATLFGAGVPLTRALFSIEAQVANASFSAIIKNVREEVESGSSFSDALKKHPRIFHELYTSMVEAGEAGGILDNVLDRLAYMYEKNAENRAKIKSATLYPKIVLVAIVIAVTILMNFVVPRFAKLYESFKVALPLPTRVLIILSKFFVSYWYLALMLSVAVYLIYRAYVATEKGRLVRDLFLLKVPIFGPIIKKSVLSRFSRVLGALYRSGLPILQSLDIVSRAVENKVMMNEVKAMEAEVRAGKSLSEPMMGSKHFPPMVTQMVSIGEQTGNLDDMLEKAAQYYDQEVDASIRNLTTTLEPVLLAVIFGMVLFLALAIFMPMWDIMKIVKR